ncbi:MAG TPA: hypothetical protein VL025_02470 [Thermoanaerobaculia bacterium]|nr:hypothetical protein [Thermoanaerobaculia bacterium]
MPPSPLIPLPGLVVAADWGAGWDKRWMARAIREKGSTAYTLSNPIPVGDSSKFLDRVRRGLPEGGTALVGFDFPIGLPAAYAKCRFDGLDFREILKKLKADKDTAFFKPTDTPCLATPFGPESAKKGSAFGLATLAEKLGFQEKEILRECDSRSKANSLFFTLGARQVGRAAADGWQKVIEPALDEVSLWPFDGPLADLLARPGVVMAEIYPALFFGSVVKGAGKEKGEPRTRVFRDLLEKARADGLEIVLTPSAEEWVEAGFASSDDFDPMLSVVGMLRHLRTEPALEPPDEPRVRKVEGWILGPPRPKTAGPRGKILPR